MPDYTHICCNCMYDTQGRYPCCNCGAPFEFDNEPNALKPRTILNRQTSPLFIGRCLGMGGFGATYLGLDNLGTKVAVKEFLPRQIAQRNRDRLSIMPLKNYENIYDYSLTGFLEEARIVARFREHSNVVGVLNFFQENKTAYFTMIYKEGITLERYIREKVKQGGITERELLSVVQQVLKGLKAVHQEDIFHRDIKPSNIYIPDRGEAFLLDFGAARQKMELDVSKSGTGFSVYLTRGYAPKEQYSYKSNQGAYTDIYALAATMYACLRGKIVNDMVEPLPDALELCNNPKILDPISNVSKQRISRELANAIIKGLKCRPEDRPQTVDEFQKLLPQGEDSPNKRFMLRGLGGQYSQQEIPVDSQLLIGRSPGECNIVVENKFISRRHCKVFVENNAVYLENLEPSHGTFVNEEEQSKSTKRKLSSGDTINLSGCEVFEVVEVSPPLPLPRSETAYQSVYAGFWKRFAASFIDNIALNALSALTMFINKISQQHAIQLPPTPLSEEDIIANMIGNYIAYIIIYNIISWIYFGVMESSTKQGTLGKIILGIKVTDLNGNRISFARATGRYFAKVVSVLTIGIGYLMAVWTKQKQALHDKIASCLVVNKN